jgi:hypothetical protein
MKTPSVLKKLLTNKIVLNVVTIIAFFNIIGYLMIGKITSVLFFIVLAILITHFSRNMIIVLGIPLFIVNLFAINYTSDIEGMENNENSNTNNVDTDKIKSTIQDKINQQNSNSSTSTSHSNNKQEGKTKQGLPKTSLDSSKKTTDESFEVGRAKRTGGYDIDYASTIEDAYDQLNNILGSDGIKRLTDDTQKLMKQQMQLAESMSQMEPMIQGMGPMMEQAKGLLEGMGDSNGGMAGIMEMAKKFGGSSDKK